MIEIHSRVAWPRRKFWRYAALTLALLLTAGLGWYWLCLHGRLGGIRTGDPLLDDYLKQARASSLLHNGIPLLSPQQWDALERKHGRTAELAALCATCGRGSAWMAARPMRYQPWDEVGYLESVYQTGHYDLPLLEKLHEARLEAWSRQLLKRSQQIASDSSLDQWHEMYQWIYRDHAAEEDQLLAEMRQCAPDQAWPYYVAAVQACELGNFSQAKGWIEQGNQAKFCELPLSAPQRLMQQALDRGQPPCGDPYLVSMLASAEMLSSAAGAELPYVDLVFSQHILLDEAARRGDTGLLNDLNYMYCRLGLAGRDDQRCLRVVRATLRQISVTSRQMLSYEIPEQAEALHNFEYAAGSVDDGVSILDQRSMHHQPDAGPSTAARLLGKLSQGRSLALEAGLREGEQRLQHRRYYDQYILPHLKETAQIVFPGVRR